MLARASGLSFFSRSVFSFEVWPLTISIEVLGILNCLERNSTNALFALLSMGCAVILIFIPSSVLIISFFDAFGEILKLINIPLSVSLYIFNNPYGPRKFFETFEWRIRQRSRARPAVQRGGSGGELLYLNDIFPVTLEKILIICMIIISWKIYLRI